MVAVRSILLLLSRKLTWCIDSKGRKHIRKICKILTLCPLWDHKNKMLRSTALSAELCFYCLWTSLALSFLHVIKTFFTRLKCSWWVKKEQNTDEFPFFIPYSTSYAHSHSQPKISSYQSQITLVLQNQTHLCHQAMAGIRKPRISL